MKNKFKEKLENDEFVLTTELFPPKGPDISKFRETARKLKGYFDAYNVTDNQRAIMRITPLVSSLVLIEEGIEPIMQITCRDRNRLAIQSDLLGAQAIGVKNILALTGDYITAGDHPNAKPVFDLDSITLLQMIKKLNNGTNDNGKQLNGKCEFFAGAALNPLMEPEEISIQVLENKIKNGAEFFQTQVIFDLEKFSRFMNKARNFKAKIIAGIFLLKSAKNARFLNKNVPGIEIPENIISLLEKSSEPLNEGISYAADLISQIKRESMCAGVHIMCIGMEEKALEILKKANLI